MTIEISGKVDGGIRIVKPLRSPGPPWLSITLCNPEIAGKQVSRDMVEIVLYGDTRTLSKLKQKLVRAKSIALQGKQINDFQFEGIGKSLQVSEGDMLQKQIKDVDFGEVTLENGVYFCVITWQGKKISLGIDSEAWIRWSLQTIKSFLRDLSEHEVQSYLALRLSILESKEFDYSMNPSPAAKLELFRGLHLEMLYLSGSESEFWFTLFYAPRQPCLFDYFQVIYDGNSYTVSADVD